jgi:hypothetical protein
MPWPLHVAVIDIGKKKNIGWGIEGPQFGKIEGTDIDACVECLASVLKEGPLALGFEAPMFVPLHGDASNLTRGRKGEGDRAFTSAPGSTVLTSGLVVVPYILNQLRARVPTATATSIGSHSQRPASMYSSLKHSSLISVRLTIILMSGMRY